MLLAQWLEACRIPVRPQDDVSECSTQNAAPMLLRCKFSLPRDPQVSQGGSNVLIGSRALGNECFSDRASWRESSLNVRSSGRVRSGRCRAEPGAAAPRGGEIIGRRAPRFRRTEENGRMAYEGGKVRQPARAEQVAGWEAGVEQLK